MAEHTVIVDSFSKTYSMTGWRLGYGVLPTALVDRVTMLVVNGTSCTPPFVQLAGLAALTGSQEGVTAVLPPLHPTLERRLFEVYAEVSGRPFGDGVGVLRDVVVADSDEEAMALWSNSGAYCGAAWDCAERRACSR